MDVNIEVKKKSKGGATKLLLCSIGFAVYGLIGTIFLGMFGTFIITDLYPFHIVESIHEDRYGRATGCYVAGAVHFLIFVIASLSVVVFTGAKAI